MPNTLRGRVVRLAASQPAGSPLRRALLAALFPSAFGVGDPVWVEVQGSRVAGHVRAVTFTTGKVRYAVLVGAEGDSTTLHNLDSVLLAPREGEPIKLEFDNYS